LGARELASGVGILSQPEPLGWLRSRVAGDIVDLLLLGLALRANTPEGRRRVALSGIAVAALLALDALGTRRLAQRLY